MSLSSWIAHVFGWFRSQPVREPPPAGTTASRASVLDYAIRRLRAGDALEAEKLCRDQLSRILQSHPEGSLAVAQAHFELATILAAVGSAAQAIEHMRSACEVTERGEAAERERLSFIMNLGDLLQNEGQLEEAETILRQGLACRETFYGKDHAGYAFGLEPLAEVLLALGRAASAAPMLERCVAIFQRDRHPRLPKALLLQVAARVSGKDPSRGVSTALVRAVVEEGLAKASHVDRRGDPAQCARWLATLRVLRDDLARQAAPESKLLIDLVRVLGQLGRRTGLSAVEPS